MVTVDLAEMSIALYVTLLGGLIVSVVLKSANSARVEVKEDMASIRSDMVTKQELAQFQMATKQDLARLESQMATKQDLAGISTKQDGFQQDLARLESQMVTKQDFAELRSEMVIMRSDLTQVALAVGAGRSQASND